MNTKRAAAALLAAAAFPVLAQGLGQAPLLEPTVPRTHSVEQADARLKEVEQQRAAALADYAASEEACNKRFFVNYCLDQAKEKRRLALSMLRAVEVEATYFKRRHEVELRDRELEERLKKDEQERVWREAQLKARPPREDAAPAAPSGKPGPSLEQRQAAHEAKLKLVREKEAAEAPERARKAAEFERRKEESERRQAKVAQRKAEREEKERLRAAEAQAAQKAAADKAAAANKPQ